MFGIKIMAKLNNIIYSIKLENKLKKKKKAKVKDIN